MTTTPPGWYDDGNGAMRWWDGGQWTEHVAVPATDDVDDTAPAPLAPAAPVETAWMPATDAPAETAFTQPAQPAKSKLWIVWVVLGVVVLATVIAAAVFVVQLVSTAALAGQSSGVTPSDEDQQAAVAAVQLYDDAWQNADCDAYFASTTANFRTQAGLPDCSSFESEAEAFGEAVEGYEVTVADVQTQDGDILVSTTESYTNLLDEDGEPLDEPTTQSDDWDYVVVLDDGVWVIDEAQ